MLTRPIAPAPSPAARAAAAIRHCVATRPSWWLDPLRELATQIEDVGTAASRPLNALDAARARTDPAGGRFFAECAAAGGPWLTRRGQRCADDGCAVLCAPLYGVGAAVGVVAGLAGTLSCGAVPRLATLVARRVRSRWVGPRSADGVREDVVVAALYRLRTGCLALQPPALVCMLALSGNAPRTVAHLPDLVEIALAELQQQLRAHHASRVRQSRDVRESLRAAQIAANRLRLAVAAADRQLAADRGASAGPDRSHAARRAGRAARRARAEQALGGARQAINAPHLRRAP